MGRENFPRRQKRDAAWEWNGGRDRKRKASKFWREKRRAAKNASRGL